jgi:hypothetical protein
MESMARPPVGTVRQSSSRTALFAYITARLHGSPPRDHDEFFRQEIGVAIGRDGAERAARPHRFESPRKKTRGTPAGPVTRVDGALRDWLLVDEQRLGLETALIRFPGDGRKQTELLDILKALPGIRQVVETAPRREIVVIAVFRDAQARRDLRAQLEEVAGRILWEEILEETHTPALATWAALARGAAVTEQLVVGQVL